MTLNLLNNSKIINIKLMGCGNMKTFKAVRFQIVNEHGRIIEYELEDGVIIKRKVARVGCLKLSFLMSIMKHLRNIKTVNSYWIFVSSSRVQPMIQLYLNLL